MSYQSSNGGLISDGTLRNASDTLQMYHEPKYHEPKYHAGATAGPGAAAAGNVTDVQPAGKFWAPRMAGCISDIHAP